MKKTLFILSFILITIVQGNANDSLKIVKLENEIEILTHKLDAIENSTDRILNALYVTIGSILAAVLGLNIWNLIVYNRKQSGLIKEELGKARTELSDIINKRIEAIPKNIHNAQELRHQQHFRDISELKLAELSSQSKYIDYNTANHEGDAIIKFLRLAKERDDYLGHGDYYVKIGLLALQGYLEKDEYIYHSDVDELIKELNSDKYKKYENYSEKIVSLLKKK